MKEKVLVVETKRLSLPTEEYIKNPEEVAAFLGAAATYSFIDRDLAENDSGYKQLIPYVTLICRDEYLVLERTKAQSEARLHGKLSLGVGGHINPVDKGADLAATISRALARELGEEMWVEMDRPPVLAGLINDDTNSVGSVHLGLHYLLPVENRPRVRETDKMRARWLPLAQLADLRLRLETWSQILLPQLANFPLPLAMTATPGTTKARR